MFDLSSRSSLKNAFLPWSRDVLRVCEDNTPMVFVGNKADEELRLPRVMYRPQFMRKLGELPYFFVSAKANYQLEQPFVWLLRRLMKDPELRLLEGPAMAPATVSMRPEKVEEVERVYTGLRLARRPEPTDDDDDT